MEPAWYIIRSSNRLWAKYLNLLHPPYLTLHLSFIVLGAALAPDLHYWRLGAMLVAFALAMGVASHALDLCRGDPLKLAIPRRQLLIVAVLSALAAVGIGVATAWVLSAPWFLLFVAFGVFQMAAYNLEWFDGAFHTDASFAIFWGVFPFLTGYITQSATFSWPLVLGMVFCYAVSRIQRVLSTRARFVRRRISRVAGYYYSEHEGQEMPTEIRREWLLAPEETALAWLCFTIPVLAVLLLVI